MSTSPELLQEAVRAFQQGALERAEQLARQLVDSDAGNADLWCLLGVVCRARGKLDDAVAHQRQALRLRPDFLEALNNLGNALVSQSQHEAAIDCYRRVLELRPAFAQAHSNLGAAFRNLNRLDEALACYREALRLEPQFPDALCNLGDLLALQGKLDEAAAHYRQVLRLRPDHVEALSSLGSVLTRTGSLDEALDHLRRAVAMRPDHAEAHCNLGNALAAQGEHGQALAAYDQALRLNPSLAVGHFNRGVALAELDRWNEALASYDEAVRLRPDHVEAWENRAGVLLNQGKPELALDGFEQALVLAPDCASAHMGRALIRLLNGDYARGWDEYEWRWKCKEFTPLRVTQPAWDGSDLSGRTILLVAEQGLGDTLQMVRYAPLVQQRGGRVVLACRPALHPLVSRSPGIDAIVPLDAALPPFDVYASLMSLPRLLGTTLDTIPSRVPYLYADSALVRSWRERLGTDDVLRIGVAWQGNPKHPNDRRRSFRLAELERLAGLEGVRLYSLQKGPGSEQLGEAAGRFPVVDLGPELDESAGAFVDTAAVMSSLDLVICPDSAVAHLAGGLGVRAWIALGIASDWRWLRAREDSPWYPSARLFRQTQAGRWSDVFERMAAEVQTLVRQGSHSRAVLVEIGPGELLDKIAILEIKHARIADPAKLAAVRTELDALLEARDSCLSPTRRLTELADELKAVNEAIWDAEDAIRDCECQGEFGARFIALARSVYRQNDRRAAIKRQVNEALHARIVEQKSYHSYE